VQAAAVYHFLLQSPSASYSSWGRMQRASHLIFANSVLDCLLF